MPMAAGVLPPVNRFEAFVPLSSCRARYYEPEHIARIQCVAPLLLAGVVAVREVMARFVFRDARTLSAPLLHPFARTSQFFIAEVPPEPAIHGTV